MSDLREHALNYARCGLHIFPLQADKTPRTQHGHRDATTDEAQIVAWWETFPDALIGCRVPADAIILDIDPRHGGDQTWLALVREHGVPTGRSHLSGRGDGGLHLWFQRPDLPTLSTKRLDYWAQEHETGHQTGGSRRTSGIDLIQHDHRYTILPPSPHPATGRAYEWINGPHFEPAPIPDWLVEMLTPPARSEWMPPTPPVAPNDLAEGPADWFTDHHSWSDVLHDWTVVRGDGESDGSGWRHPAATSEVSATVTHGLLFVHSTSTAFEPTSPGDPHGYTKFRAYALLRHGGDLSAAAKAAIGMGAPTSATGADSRRFDEIVADIHSKGENCHLPATDPYERRSLVLTRAADIVVRPVRWLWEKRVPLGALTLVGGRENIGKSTLCYQLAADITHGRMEGDFYHSPKAVIIVATEDSWAHTIVPRLLGAGANLDLIYRVGVQTVAGIEGTLNLPLDLPDMEDLVEKVGAGAIILDPLLSRLDAGLDSHKDADVRRALEPLVAFADRARVAIFGVIHVNKGTSMDPLTMLMASRAFSAVSRAVLFVASDPDQERLRVLGLPKHNLGPEMPDLAFTIEGRKVADTDEGPVWTGCLSWMGVSERSLDEVIRGVSKSSKDRPERQEAAAWLRDYLSAHKVMSSAQVKADARKAGYGPATVKRARAKIGARVTHGGFPHTTFWSAPGLSPDEVDHLLAETGASSAPTAAASTRPQLKLVPGNNDEPF